MAKKNFKQYNPAEAFITMPEEQPVKPAPIEAEPIENVQPPKGYKRNPAFIETKSKRVQLLLQPSTVEKLKATAKAKGLSMNEAANEAIIQYLAKENANDRN